jgi:5'-deoxynucleotidase YfbR-like HD superfamily hydrolase
MNCLDKILQDFPERTESLSAISRFTGMSFMIYRTNLDDHQRIVYWLVDELLDCAAESMPDYFDELMKSKTRTSAVFHDDPEILTGDISLGDKLTMNPWQRKFMGLYEAIAIEVLSQKSPEMVNGFDYRSMLYSALLKNEAFAQLNSYADKLAGYIESMNEAQGGNRTFLVDVKSSNTSLLSYIQILQERKLWPLIEPVFECDHPLLKKPEDYDIVSITNKGKLHTEESIRQPTVCPIYDKGKEIILDKGEERGLQILTKPKEMPQIEISWAELKMIVEGLLPNKKNIPSLRKLLSQLEPFVTS